jgi:hypothetical protein
VIEKYTAEWRIRPGVAVDDSNQSLDQAIGDVYVSTLATRWIDKYTADGEYIGRIASSRWWTLTTDNGWSMGVGPTVIDGAQQREH